MSFSVCHSKDTRQQIAISLKQIYIRVERPFYFWTKDDVYSLVAVYRHVSILLLFQSVALS